MTEIFVRLPLEERISRRIDRVRRSLDRLDHYRLAVLGLGVSVFLFGWTLAAIAQSPAPYRLGTGAENGNYFVSGQVIKAASKKVPVDVKTTDGGTSNLDGMLAGTLDGGFVPTDALALYTSKNARTIAAVKRVGALYDEQVHLLCNRKAEISALGDLSAKTRLAFGSAGSLATWNAIRRAQGKRFDAVPVDGRTGKEAMLAAADGKEVQCVLYVAAFGTSYIRDEAQELGDSLVLVPTADSEVLKTVQDERRDPAYHVGSINAAAYPRIMPGNWRGRAKAVEVLEVPAVLVSAVAYQTANPQAYDAILDAFRSSVADIKRRIAQ